MSTTQEPVEQTPEFKKAVTDSRSLKQKPDQNEMLKLYSLFKQASQDPPFENATTPGMFDMTGKYKYNAWKEVSDKGTTPEDAQKQYVQTVDELKEKYGFEEQAPDQSQ